MTIKIEKEIEVNMDSSRGELGIEITWYWVRVYDEEAAIKLQKVYKEMEEARKAYVGLIAYYEKNNSIESKIETLAIYSISDI